MVVGYRKQFSLPPDYPSFTVYSLTLWTVPVSATVIKVPFMPTTPAFTLMSAQRGSSTPGYSIKDFYYLPCLWVLLKKIAAVLMNYL